MTRNFVNKIIQPFGIKISNIDEHNLMADLYKSMWSGSFRFNKPLFSQIRKKYSFEFKFPKSDGFISAIKLQLCDDWLPDIYRSSVDEFSSLYPVLSNLFSSAPKTIVDLGGGVGRSSVYLANSLGWNKSSFILVDKDKDLGNLKSSVINGKSILNKYQTGYHSHSVPLSDSS